MLRAVFFDLYNTLARFEPLREDLQERVCAQYGIDVEREGVIAGYVDADDYMARENAKLHLAKRTEQEQWDFFAQYERLILRGAGVDVPAQIAGEIFQAIRAIPYHLALYDDALPCINRLRTRGLIVGMISNIYSDLKRTCTRLGLADCLDFWVTSKEAGSEKPHPGIFQLALSKAGVQPEEAIHVGDQYYSDVAGARGTGITPILIDRAGLSTGQECIVISDLNELPRLPSLSPNP